jgi:hypothetical protein
MAVEALIDQLETRADTVIDTRMESMAFGIVGGCLESDFQLVYLVPNGYKALLYVVHKFPTLSIATVTLG